MNDTRLLLIYLRDHHAAISALHEVAKRASGSNSSTALGDLLESMADDLRSDARLLTEVMARYGASPDRLKQAAAWSAGKLGRLKLNGRLLGYSELSRVLELESLHVFARGRFVLWTVLGDVAASDERLAGLDLGAAAERARAQAASLEDYIREAADTAFG